MYQISSFLPCIYIPLVCYKYINVNGIVTSRFINTNIIRLLHVYLQGSGMSVTGNQYKKNEDWRKIAYIGSGVAGKCYLAVDLRTEAQFAVKKVCSALLKARNFCDV